jgi:hypothetical protein
MKQASKNAMRTILGICAAMGMHTAFAQPCGNFNNNYANATGWTQNGGGYTINNGFNFNNTACAAYNYATSPLPGNCVLSNDYWCAEIDFSYDGRAGYGVAHSLLSFNSGTANSWNANPNYSVSNQNVIEAYINCGVNAAAGTETIQGRAKSGTTWLAPSAGIAVNINNDYRIRLQRLSPTQGAITVFTLVNNVPTFLGSACFAISQNVTGLNTLLHGCIPQGSSQRTLTGTLTNLVVNNNNQPVAITSPASVCAGSNSTNICLPQLCFAPAYTWTVPNGSTITSGQNTSCINTTWGGNSGNITATVTYPNLAACPVNYTVPITVNQVLANAGPNITLCCGTITYLGNGTGTGSGGTPPYSFSWLPTTGLSNPNIATPQVFCGNYALGQTVTYTLTVTDANGCTATSTVSVTRPLTNCRIAGTNDQSSDNEFEVMPNPGTGIFMLQFNHKNEARMIEVLDMTGRIVYTHPQFIGSALEIDLTELPKGLYMIRSTGSNSMTIRKVVLQ